MPRPPRVDLADYYYHVLNRANARTQIFNSADDYRHFIYLLEESVELIDMRLLAYCLMPNHWHLIVQPRLDGDLSKFVSRLTNTHVKQYKSIHDQVGYGHLYQGRYKSFLIGDDNYFYTTLRYVERNALRANLCGRAEGWQWGSAHNRYTGNPKHLSPLPIDLSESYFDDLNRPLTASEEESLECSEQSSQSYASFEWQEDFKTRHK